MVNESCLSVRGQLDRCSWAGRSSRLYSQLLVRPRRSTVEYAVDRLCNAEVAVYLSGSVLVSINEVALRFARLVLGWMTMSGLQLPAQETYLSM